MSKWNSKRGIYIPDMEPPKTLVCEVCGSKIVPNKDNRYTATDRPCTGGLSNAITGSYTEPKEYEAYDCKICGCQLIVQERLKKVGE